MSEQHPVFESKPKRQRVVSNRARAAAQRDLEEQNEQREANEDENKLCHLETASDLPPIPRNFEYGDHTADIIFHGYGQTAEQTFESVTYAMISYMFDYPERTSINPNLTHTIHIEAQDIPELVFRYLTEILVQSISYYDDLPASMKRKIPEPSYPGMIPRSVRVLKFSEETIHTNTPQSTTPVVQEATTTNSTTSASNEKKIVKAQLCTADDDDNVTNQCNGNQAATRAPTSYQKFILDVEIQGDWIDTVKLGAGTEVKAITRELTCLQTITDPQLKKQKGNYHMQVLVDI